MGLFSFVKSAGRKLGMFGGKGAAEAEAAAEVARVAAATAQEAGQRAAAMAADIKAAIASHGIEIADLGVAFVDPTAVLNGTASAQVDAEKAVLIAGNTEGVGQVDDQLEVVVPEPPALHHTVVEGDTLSAVSKVFYGTFFMYDEIFEANKPMLEHPDLIYPGQVLRIPRAAHKVHVVAAGETLGGIAKHYYGSAGRYTEIFAANTDTLSSPDVVEVGVQLKIPLSGPAAEGVAIA